MRTIDYTQHNEEVKEVWDSFYSGKPIRVPMILGINPRIAINNFNVNTNKYTFKEYFTNPKARLTYLLEYCNHIRHNIPQDIEMGIPEKGWDLYIDLQNVFEDAWLGGKVKFPENQCPIVEPFLNDDNKYSIIDKGIPEVYSGILAMAREHYDYMVDQKKSGFTYLGKPVNKIDFTGMSTDGPLTIACNLRGVDNFIIDLMYDSEYAHKLLSFITEATIYRIKALRQDFNIPEKVDDIFFADDNIELISSDMYISEILPYHEKLLEALATKDAKRGIHICGNAQRHHKILVEKLGITAIDTGFPMDFNIERELVGENVTIMGGPSVPFLDTHNYDETYEEVKNILNSGITKGGKFILREGNNLPPTTPLENIWAMYDCVKEHGKYQN